MRLAKLLRFVESKTASQINMETIAPVFFSAERLHVDPDQHVHAGFFCRETKFGGNLKRCSENKTRSIEIARHGRIFCSECPFGVWEMACPVIYDGSLAAVVYLGAFRTRTDASEKDTAFNKLSLIDQERKKKLFEWGKFIVKFIQTELALLAAEEPALFRRQTDKSLLAQCMAFINQRYVEDISLIDLSSVLSLNPNYLSDRIHKLSGKTFRTLLNEKRVYEAETYLRMHKKLSISEIAVLCGFKDSNYFSTVFKKFKGQSPLQFRRG